MPLLEKIERIAWDCGVDPHLPMAAIVREANEMMGLSASGSLPAQAEALLLTMGVDIPRERPVPIRKARQPAAVSAPPVRVLAPEAEARAPPAPPPAPPPARSPARPPAPPDEDDFEPPPDPNAWIPATRKKQRKPPPRGFRADDEEVVRADAEEDCAEDADVTSARELDPPLPPSRTAVPARSARAPPADPQEAPPPSSCESNGAADPPAVAEPANGSHKQADSCRLSVRENEDGSVELSIV